MPYPSTPCRSILGLTPNDTAQNNELQQDKLETANIRQRGSTTTGLSVAISSIMCPANKGLVDMANRAFEPPQEYFSVSIIAVNPDRIDEAHACLTEVAEATLKEPGAKIYRFYKTEGKDEFVCMEKFTSRDAYAAHTSSEHVKEWAKKYLDSGIFVGSFTFHHLAKEGPGAGGFDRP